MRTPAEVHRKNFFPSSSHPPLAAEANASLADCTKSVRNEKKNPLKKPVLASEDTLLYEPLTKRYQKHLKREGAVFKTAGISRKRFFFHPTPPHPSHLPLALRALPSSSSSLCRLSNFGSSDVNRHAPLGTLDVPYPSFQDEAVEDEEKGEERVGAGEKKTKKRAREAAPRVTGRSISGRQ